MIDWTHSCRSVPTGSGTTYRSYTPYLYRNQPLAPHFELNRPIKNPSTFLGGLALDFLSLLRLNIAWIEQLLQFNLKCTLLNWTELSFHVFRTKLLELGTLYFTSPTGDGTAILGGHPSHAKVYPFAGQRKYLHFSVVLRPWVLGPAPGIESATFRSAVTLSTDWVNPAAVLTL